MQLLSVGPDSTIDKSRMEREAHDGRPNAATGPQLSAAPHSFGAGPLPSSHEDRNRFQRLCGQAELLSLPSSSGESIQDPGGDGSQGQAQRGAGQDEGQPGANKLTNLNHQLREGSNQDLGSRQEVPAAQSASMARPQEFLKVCVQESANGSDLAVAGDASSDLLVHQRQKEVGAPVHVQSEDSDLACVVIENQTRERKACHMLLQSVKPAWIHVSCRGQISWKRELSVMLQLASDCLQWQPQLVLEHPWFKHKKVHKLVKEFIKGHPQSVWYWKTLGENWVLTNVDIPEEEDGKIARDEDVRWQVRAMGNELRSWMLTRSPENITSTKDDFATFSC